MSRPQIIVDTDILSMFAKVDAIGVLAAFFGPGCLAMTPAIYDEITAPLHYGYTYPHTVLSQIPVVVLSEPVWREYERLESLRASLGKAELQAIAFCKAAGAVFATNDRAARRLAREQGVPVVTLQALLRGLWVSGVHSRDDVQLLLARIKVADALEVSPEVERDIFAEPGAADSPP